LIEPVRVVRLVEKSPVLPGDFLMDSVVQRRLGGMEGDAFDQALWLAIGDDGPIRRFGVDFPLAFDAGTPVCDECSKD
jgi:hypothetical protein